MIIGIDASRYSHKSATGVENYSRNIIDGILSEFLQNPEDKIVLYVRDAPEIKNLQKNVSVKIIDNKRLWTLRGLSAEMKTNPPDILFVPSHVLPLTLPKKSVVTIHDVAFRHLRRAYSFSQYHYLNWSTKFAVKHSTRIIVPSQATANDLVNIFCCPRNKITVILHGFSEPKVDHSHIRNLSFKDFDAFKYADFPKNMKYMFFVGRLEIKKNIKRLVEAFNLFREKYPDYWIVLGGKRGEGFSKIIKNLRRRCLLKNVLMPGYLSEDEKAFLYMNCEFFVFPSLYEGFGLPLLDAFYYEKPILCSNIDVLREIYGDSACYCNPLDTVDIKDGMLKLAKDQAYRQKLSASGKERLKKFSWRISTKRTLQTLRAVYLKKPKHG